jgi:hypothetical protein
VFHRAEHGNGLDRGPQSTPWAAGLVDFPSLGDCVVDGNAPRTQLPDHSTLQVGLVLQDRIHECDATYHRPVLKNPNTCEVHSSNDLGAEGRAAAKKPARLTRLAG